MKTRVLGVALLAAAAFAVTGCGVTGTGTPSTPVSSQAPVKAAAKDAFTAAVKKTNSTTSKQELSMQGVATMSATGANDPTAQKLSMEMDMTVPGAGTLKMSCVSLGGDVYFKMTGVPGMPQQWMKVKADQIKAGSSLDLKSASDPSRTLDSVVTIEWDGDNAFKGTIDATKNPNVGADAVKQLGDKAKSVPFTATINAEGYLTGMSLDMNSIQAGLGTMKTTYSAFGQPVTVTAPPASDVVEMPPALLAAMSQG